MTDCLQSLTFFTFTYFTAEDISFLWLEARKWESVLVGKYGSSLITRHGTEAQILMDRQLQVIQPFILAIIINNNNN